MMCERCQDLESEAQIVDLSGGAYAALCHHCQNLFKEALDNDPLIHECFRLNAKENFYNQRGSTATQEDWLKYEYENLEFRKRLRLFIKEWL
jgi:hypothetical protein